jgi:hypothetical protein
MQQGEEGSVRTSAKSGAALLVGAATVLYPGAWIPALAQDNGTVALPVFEKVVDAYGVDRITGKYSMTPNTIINIGGENGLPLTYSDSGESSLVKN